MKIRVFSSKKHEKETACDRTSHKETELARDKELKPTLPCVTMSYKIGGFGFR